MLDDLHEAAFAQESLTQCDRSEIVATAQILPGEWITEFEETPDGDWYACLLPPWSDGLMSAFLIERQRNRVVLTDRLSAFTRDLVSDHNNVCGAMQTVCAIVLGNSDPLRPENS